MTFEQVMALYNAAPEKWGYAGGRAPVYFPKAKGKTAFWSTCCPRSGNATAGGSTGGSPTGRDAGQFQMTAKALLSMQEDLADHLQSLQEGTEKPSRNLWRHTQRILDRQQEETERKSQNL